MKCLFPTSLILLLALSSAAWAEETQGRPTAGLHTDIKTGYFRKTTTPLELLGEQGAQVVAGVFAADEKLRWQLYVPKNYDPAKPAGVIVFINRGTWGGGLKVWNDVLEDKNIIWIGALGAGDQSPLNERMLKAILAPLLLAQDYEIDADRVYVSGFSGGGQVATILATSKPETFKGGLFMSGAMFWGAKAPPKLSLVQQNRYVFTTGSNDVAKTKVQRTAEAYRSAGVDNTHLIIVQNMRQELPGPTYFAAAIDYLDARN